MLNEETQDCSTKIFMDTDSLDEYPGKTLTEEEKKIKIPNCKLLRELGVGGMGKVYLAKQTLLNRLVAVKCIRMSHSSSAQLKAEAMTMAALNHPNIVGCYDFVRADDKLYVIMEFVPGSLSVRRVVKQYGPLPENIVAQILKDVVSGLSYMNSKGYIHRDMKPDNLLIYSDISLENKSLKEIFDAKTTRVKICDFGIAKTEQTPVFIKGADNCNKPVGSPNYMAPEQVFSPDEVDFRSDIYSLCGTLIFMLTGKPPFDIEDRNKLLEHKLDNNIPVPSLHEAKLSHQMIKIIKMMGQAAQEDRYQNYAELQNDVDVLYSQTHKSLFGEWRILSFWRSLCFGILALIVSIGIVYYQNYSLKHNFKKRLPSFSNSMAFWSGDKEAWQILASENKEFPSILSSINDNEAHILKLRPVIAPGQSLEYHIKRPDPGIIYFQFSDSESPQFKLIWDRNAKGINMFTLHSNGNTYPIEYLPEHFGQEWINIRFELKKSGVAVYFENDLACMVRTKALHPLSFSIYTKNTSNTFLRDIIVYDTNF